MLLQIELIMLVVAIAALILIIFWISRRQPAPQALQDVARFTPGEQEILRQLGEMRERVEKMIPPYGKVGYIPSSLDELRDLLGFSYIEIDGKTLGQKPSIVAQFENLNVDFLQARIGETYVYVITRGSKKLIATGSQHLDYLTLRFLAEFLDYY